MARAGLSRDAVLDAAVALADEHGLDKLSMRQLAANLGVEAMSLYNHVAHKRALLEGIVDRVWAQVDLAADEPDWRAALHRLAASAYEAMLAHPWFFELPVTYGGTARLAVLDAMLGHMRRSGASAAEVFHLQHVLDGQIYGYAWQAIGFSSGDLDQRADEMLAAINPDRLPHLMEHARLHMEAVPPGDGFTLGIDAILDAVERASR